MNVVWGFLLLLSLMMNMDAMERANPSIPVNATCYLKVLPVDICNKIMFFIEWETKKEFIERTQRIEALPSFWVCLKNKYNKQEALFHELCPDKSKIAIVNFVESQNSVKSTLVIMDKNENRLYDGTFAYQIYHHIALAQSGYMIATIQKQERPAGETLHDYKNILTVQKIAKDKEQIIKLQETQRAILPDGFESSSLAFNKQDTCLIMHGKQCGNTDSHEKTYKMWKLLALKEEFIDHNYIPSEKEKKNTLGLYLRYHMVCNKW